MLKLNICSLKPQKNQDDGKIARIDRRMNKFGKYVRSSFLLLIMRLASAWLLKRSMMVQSFGFTGAIDDLA